MPGNSVFAALDFADQIVAQFVLDAAARDLLFGKSAVSESAERLRKKSDVGMHISPVNLPRL